MSRPELGGNMRSTWRLIAIVWAALAIFTPAVEANALDCTAILRDGKQVETHSSFLNWKSKYRLKLNLRAHSSFPHSTMRTFNWKMKRAKYMTWGTCIQVPIRYLSTQFVFQPETTMFEFHLNQILIPTVGCI